MAGEHAFADETMRGGYVVVAAVTGAGTVTATRSVMRSLLLGSQTHLHFTKEDDGRRRQIAKAICGTGILIDIYDASALQAKPARESCLERIVADLAAAQASRLVVEMDESLMRRDRQVLASAVKKHGVDGQLTYVHMRKREEPVLWVADAAAWCWTHGDAWKRQIDGVVRNVTVIR